MKLSLIIPTYNESQILPKTLTQVCEMGFDEILVVDGGSLDQTEVITRNFPVIFFKAPQKGRGAQLHHGAQMAQGDIFFFMHADTQLPTHAVQAIGQALQNSRTIAGGFSKVFDHSHLLLRGEAKKCRARLRCLKTISGDQGLFVRREDYFAVGGYPPVRLMEEFILCKRLRQRGNLVLLPDCVTTSARRFLEHGVIRTYLRMGITTLFYYLGFGPGTLEKIYFKK